MKLRNFPKCDGLKIIYEWKWIMENEIYISLIVTLMEFVYKHKISLIRLLTIVLNFVYIKA